jgi:hypothetical protein
MVVDEYKNDCPNVRSSSSFCHRQRLPQIGCDAPPSISGHFPSNCAICSPCISFEGMYPFATSSHLVIKLQMLFRADMVNFFGQESVVPEPPLFGFKSTVVYVPSHSAIVNLFFPQTSAISWASSSAYSDVTVLFTCVNFLMAACQEIKVHTVSPLMIPIGLWTKYQQPAENPSRTEQSDYQHYVEGLLSCSMCHYRR